MQILEDTQLTKRVFYAVVCQFENVLRPTVFDSVSHGRLISRLFLFHTDTIPCCTSSPRDRP